MNRLLFLLFTAIAISGCTKSDQDENTPKHEFLTKMLQIEEGDTTKVLLEYNKKNLLSKVIHQEMGYTKLEYYPSGELAISDTHLSLGGGQVLRSHVLYSYNDDDVIESALVKIYENNRLSKSVNLSYYLNDKNQVTEVISDDELAIASEYLTYDEAGNIAEIERYGHSGVMLENFEYNEKSSCLKNVGLKYYVGSTSLFAGLHDSVRPLIPIDLFNANSVSSYENSNTGIKNEYVDFEFDSRDYPLSFSVTSGGVTNAAEQKYEYELR